MVIGKCCGCFLVIAEKMQKKRFLMKNSLQINRKSLNLWSQ